MNPAVVRIAGEEGTLVVFERAGLGERVGAFVLDLVVIGCLLLALLTACTAASMITPGASGAAMILSYFIVFFWFGWCESGRRAATPGKRVLGLRVVDRRGRVLTPEAAFVRNTVRWFEMAGPLVMFFNAGDVFGQWREAAFCGWLFGFALVPFVRRDGLRLGDLAADTMVVRNPKAGLRGELATREATNSAAGFGDAQLEFYGEAELTVLETLLRAPPSTLSRSRLAQAATIIAKKIGREPPRAAEAEAWLRAFYAAQRNRLEHRLVLGRRKRDKHS